MLLKKLTIELVLTQRIDCNKHSYFIQTRLMGKTLMRFSIKISGLPFEILLSSGPWIGGSPMKTGFFIGLLLISQTCLGISAHASLKSMVKFFAVEFEGAKTLRDELQALTPKDNSNEKKLLDLVSTYLDQIGKMGGLMKDHYERRPVPPESVIESLKAINQAEIPLIEFIPQLLFKKFNMDFLHRRRNEDLADRQDPSKPNPIWYRAIHFGEAIDFCKWFTDDVNWVTSPSNDADSEQNKNAPFFNWLQDNIHHVTRLIEHDGETAFDWAYERPSVYAETDASTSLSSPNQESPQESPQRRQDGDSVASPEAEPFHSHRELLQKSLQESPRPEVRGIFTPLLTKKKEEAVHKKDSKTEPLLPRKPKKPIPKSFWQAWADDLNTTTLQEFREAMGGILW